MFFGWDRNLLGAHSGCVEGKRVMLHLPLSGGMERDCSVFIFNLATKAFLVSFQFLGSSVSCAHKTLPIEQQFCSFSGRNLGKAQLEHRVTTRQRMTNPTSARGCSVLERVTHCSLCQAVASCPGLQHHLRAGVGKSGTILARFQPQRSGNISSQLHPCMSQRSSQGCLSADQFEGRSL